MIAILGIILAMWFIVAMIVLETGNANALDQILLQLNLIQGEQKKMAGEIDALAQQVADTLGVEQSAIQTLDAIHAMLIDALNTNDISKVVSITEQLKTSRDNLVAAITRDAAPAPPAPEPPPAQ